MTTPRATLLAAVDPCGAHWELGPLPPIEGRILLLGWTLEPPPTDAGVPEPVARLLAEALLDFADVLPVPPELPPDPDPDPDPERLARALFEDPRHPWWLRARAAALLDPAAPHPIPDPPPDLRPLLETDWAARAAALARGPLPALRAVLRPGVDGDVAALLLLRPDPDSDPLPAFLDNLRERALQRGIPLRVLNETEFAEALASPSDP